MLLLCFLMGKLWFSHSSALAMHWQSECSFKQAVYLPRTTCVFADIGPSVSHRELQTYSLQRAEVKLRKVSTATTVCLFWGCCCFFHFWWVFSEILPFLVNSVITLCSCDFGSMHGEKKSDGIFFDLLDRQIWCVLKARGVFYLAGFCAWSEKRHGC